VKKSSGFFIYSAMVTFAFTLICGGRSPGLPGFKQNFEVCIILIPIAVGLVLYGAYMFRKEKKSKSQK
jgi:hypothetical protein